MEGGGGENMTNTVFRFFGKYILSEIVIALTGISRQ
jgi:hypothetical protein